MGDEEDRDEAIDKALDRYDKTGGDDKDNGGGMSSVSRAGAKGRATQVIAEIDSKGVFKSDRAKELLIDLSARTNFRSRNERIYFLDWVDWCEEFGVGFEGPILYMATARSENAEGVKQLITALTSQRIDHHQYGGNGHKQREVPSDPITS